MGNYNPARRSRMTWQGNLAQMKAEATVVTRMCANPCRFSEPVDLDAMIALLGPDGDLWDQRPPCPSCDRLNHFVAAPSPGTPARPLLSWNRGPDPRRPPGGWPPWPPAPHSPPAMAVYTLVFSSYRDGHQHVTAVDASDEKTLIDDARVALTKEHTTVAVARGTGEDLEFLGIWDRLPDGTLQWTPEE